MGAQVPGPTGTDRVAQCSIEFEVGPVGSDRAARIAAWEFAPRDMEPRAVVLAIPGGSYRKDYWHLVVPGRSGYSFAEHLSAAGFAVVAVDNYGTGDSTMPAHGDAATLDAMSCANSAVAAQLRDRHPGVPVIGIGHSMGASLAMMQQARDHSFDAVGLFGQGCQALPGTDGSLPVEEQLAESEARAAASHVCHDGYYELDRSRYRSHFHWDDVPDDVIAADDAVATVLPRLALHVVAVTAGSRPSAATIDVPIFQAFGERDNTPNPHADGVYFSSCPDYTLFVLERSGHCHNFASGRRRLWDRFAGWARTFDATRR